jgi:phosphohistidine phosphatase
MKQVLVVRHVNSEAAEESLGDFVRQINDDGERQARALAQKVVELDLLPEHLVTSDAVRAVQTAEAFRDHSGYTGRIEENPDLYDATEETYMDVLCNCDDTLKRIMIVGHNPAVEAVVKQLIGKHRKMKPGSAAVVVADVESWRDLIGADAVRLQTFIEPNGR